MNFLYTSVILCLFVENNIKLKVYAHGSTEDDPPKETQKETTNEEPPFIDERAKYRVVMVRHGQSEANQMDLFGGWGNYNLTRKGREQAKRAGTILKKQGYMFDVAYTSFLRRASETLEIILEMLGQSAIEKHEAWQLNDCHSGQLTGQNHVDVKEKYGEEQFRIWKRSYNGRAPAMTADNPFYKSITVDSRYRQDPDFVDFPSSESIMDVISRVFPYWEKVIVPQMKNGKRVLIAGHSGMFRAMVAHFENLTDSQILAVKTPNASPFIYEFDEDMNPIIPRKFIPDVADS